MNGEYWMVKRIAFACICITQDFHGTATVWNSSDEAWDDARDRAEDFIQEDNRFTYKKVEDGYEVMNKYTKEIVRYYKIFDVQELE